MSNNNNNNRGEAINALREAAQKVVNSYEVMMRTSSAIRPQHPLVGNSGVIHIDYAMNELRAALSAVPKEENTNV